MTCRPFSGGGGGGESDGLKLLKSTPKALRKILAGGKPRARKLRSTKRLGTATDVVRPYSRSSIASMREWVSIQVSPNLRCSSRSSLLCSRMWEDERSNTVGTCRATAHFNDGSLHCDQPWITWLPCRCLAARVANQRWTHH